MTVTKPAVCGQSSLISTHPGYQLCKSSIFSSRWVWNQLRYAKKYKTGIGEESITDFFVLNFKRWSPPGFAIKTFTRREEAVNGSDWEWWFGSKGKWLGMRVQAKVIDQRLFFEYSHLHYQSKEQKKSGKRQADYLIENAEAKQLIPIFCLYSYWSPETQTLLKRIYKKSGFRMTEFGASILSAYHVQSHPAKKEIDAFFPELVPLCKLFCIETAVDSNFPESFLQNTLADRLVKDIQNKRNLIKDNPPDYVRLLLYEGYIPEQIFREDTELKRISIFWVDDNENSN